MSCLGQEFRRGAIVCTKQPSDHDYYDFGEVSHILVHEEANLKQLLFHIIIKPMDVALCL